jgi:hypothetical protein
MLPSQGLKRVPTGNTCKALAVSQSIQFGNEILENTPGMRNMKGAYAWEWIIVTNLTVLKVKSSYPNFTYNRCQLPITETSTRNHPGVKARPVRKADNFAAICEPTVYKSGSLDVSQPYRLPNPVTGIALPFYALNNHACPMDHL